VTTNHTRLNTFLHTSSLIGAVLGLCWGSTTWAAVEFDQDVTPEVIFGSGNDNGSFTTDRRNGIEIGLRGKVRFPAPENTFHSNGDGTYSFDADNACPAGYGFARCNTTPIWSFEWSVNTDIDGGSGRRLQDLHYEIGLDGDPGPGTDFLTFDPITPTLLTPAWDHAIGSSGTPNGGGQSTDDEATYEMLIGLNTVAQNSWNYEFYNNLGTSLASFDPEQTGNYVIYLLARDPDNGRVLAKSQIQILAGGAKQYRRFESQAKK
jgi:hypothetical protein